MGLIREDLKSQNRGIGSLDALESLAKLLGHDVDSLVVAPTSHAGISADADSGLDHNLEPHQRIGVPNESRNRIKTRNEV